MDWGHYSTVVQHYEFILVVVAWSLFVVDALQQVNKLRRKRKDKAQWEKS